MFPANRLNVFPMSLRSRWPQSQQVTPRCPDPLCPPRRAPFCPRPVPGAGTGNLKVTRTPRVVRCRSRWPATPRRPPCCHSYCQLSRRTRRRASRSSWVARAQVRQAEGVAARRHLWVWPFVFVRGRNLLSHVWFYCAPLGFLSLWVYSSVIRVLWLWLMDSLQLLVA